MDFHGMTKESSVLRFNTENERKYMRNSMVTPSNKVFPEYFLLRIHQFNEIAKTPIEEWMAYLKDGVISEDTSTPGLQEARSKLSVLKNSTSRWTPL